jgi:hypothetical protein
MRSTSASVAAKSSRDSPGKPTITSVESVSPVRRRAARRCAQVLGHRVGGSALEQAVASA